VKRGVVLHFDVLAGEQDAAVRKFASVHVNGSFERIFLDIQFRGVG
jgi:hypothetical protein